MTASTMRIGYLPLVDAAIPILAHELGFASDEGLKLELIGDQSWATVRDRLIYGHTDAAHLLAPLAIATSLGLGRPPVKLVAPFSLGLNGNAITLLAPLAQKLRKLGGAVDDPAATGAALARLISERPYARLRLAVVHRFSSHNYMLRYWLAACGIDPEKDVDIVVVPPPFTGEALASGEIHGACVGEPWNSLAVDAGAAEIIGTTATIWQRGVEKVLAMRADVADGDPGRRDALLRALDRAARVAGDPDRQQEVAEIIGGERYLNKPASLIERALSGRLTFAANSEHDAPRPDFLLFYRDAANYPWVSQALWLYSQMVRWGHAAWDAQALEIVRQVFQPQIYRRALIDTGTPLPGAMEKVEGSIAVPTGVGTFRGRLMLGPDRFFDGRRFDPDDLEGYLASLTSPPR